MIKYKLINNEYEVNGCETDAINVIIPKTHLGKKITSIDNYSFYNCTSLTNISIPASVKSIGDSAFWNCTSLIAKSGNYKAFNKYMRCRGFQYEVGKTYTLDGTLKLCERGFHYVTNLYDIFDYYSGKLQEGPIICEVEPLGNIEKNNEDSKCCTDKIKIGRRLSTQEIINVLNNKEI